jgi:hypothetical protein
MKHVTVILFLLLTAIAAESQMIDELPKDEQGNLNFNEVVKVDSASKEQLYFRTKEYFANTFKSAKDVIQLDDKESGTMIGKAWTAIYIRVMGNPVHVRMWYSLKIQCKEGRYKAEIYDVSYQGDTGPPGYPNEMFDRKSYFKNNGQPRDVLEKYKTETVKTTNDILNSIQLAMKKSSVAASKDDW